MTLELIDTNNADALLPVSTNRERRASNLKLKIQVRLKVFIACVCLAYAVHFLQAHDSIAKLMGLALLIPIPSCCYLGWRDYAALKQAGTSPAALTSELQDLLG